MTCGRRGGPAAFLLMDVALVPVPLILLSYPYGVLSWDRYEVGGHLKDGNLTKGGGRTAGGVGR